MIKHSITLVLMLLALAACGSGQPLAPWQQDPSDYPEADYLRASGSGESQAAAQQRALANLARIFVVTIRDQGVDFTQSRTDATGSGVIRQTGRTIDSFAEQVLEGARVAEYWRDTEGHHYALAVLEKAPASAALRREIGELDRDSNQRVRDGEAQASPLAALAALEQARQWQLSRALLRQKLDVLGTPAPPPRYPPAALEQRIRDQLRRMPVSVHTEDPRLRPLLQGALTRLGVPLDAEAPYRLEARLGLEPLKWEQGWYWQRGALALVLSRTSDGQAQASRRWPVKAAATDQTLVAERLQDHLSSTLAERVYVLLTDPDEEN